MSVLEGRQEEREGDRADWSKDCCRISPTEIKDSKDCRM